VLRYDFYPLLKRAGLRRVRLHDLRHTAATLALRGGTDLKRITDMLGHSTVSTTGNIYAHTTYDTLSDATAAIERQIKQA
jgi:integrase